MEQAVKLFAHVTVYSYSFLEAASAKLKQNKKLAEIVSWQRRRVNDDGFIS